MQVHIFTQHSLLFLCQVICHVIHVMWSCHVIMGPVVCINLCLLHSLASIILEISLYFPRTIFSSYHGTFFCFWYLNSFIVVCSRYPCWLYPQIGRQYVMKNNAAIAVIQCKLPCSLFRIVVLFKDIAYFPLVHFSLYFFYFVFCLLGLKSWYELLNIREIIT